MFELLELDISVKNKLLGEAHNHLCLAVNELWDNHPQPSTSTPISLQRQESQQAALTAASSVSLHRTNSNRPEL